VLGTLDRDRIFRVQTPQAFPLEVLLRAYENAFEKGIEGTDDSRLVEELGVEVRAVEGDPRKFKITTREDLELASILMRGSWT